MIKATTTTSWSEGYAHHLVGQRVRLIKTMNGLQPGLMGTVVRAELIDHQWVIFIEWHPAFGEPYQDPFDCLEWERYLDFW